MSRQHYYPTVEEINQFLIEQEFIQEDIDKIAGDLLEWIKTDYQWLIETGMPPFTSGMEELYQCFLNSSDDRSYFDRMEGAEYYDS